jgi:hypothetical protein
MMNICTEANIDTTVDIEFDFDLDELDLEQVVNDHVEQMLDTYISHPDDTCSVGRAFKNAVRLTVQQMLADPTC